MKRHLYLIIFLISYLNSYAQSPQLINYQGVARELNGNPIKNKAITIKIEILNALDDIDAVYTEIQNIKTNEFGLYTLKIGNGIVQKGLFNQIKWENGNKFIRVSVDMKSNNEFELLGTTQLLSVPYALYADKAGIANQVVKKLSDNVRTGGVNSNSSHSSADANYIPKFTSLNVIGKSSLFDNGNIGIGTNSPVAKLHVRNTSSSNSEIRIQHTNNLGASRLSFFNDTVNTFTATANYGILNKYALGASGSVAPKFPLSKLFSFNNSQGNLMISTGGHIGLGRFNQSNSTVSVRLFIDSATGFIGINHSNPVTNLHVVGSELTTGYFSSNGIDNTTGILKSEYIGSTIDDHIAINGISIPITSDNFGIGVNGEGGYIGVNSFAKNSSVNPTYGSLNIASNNGESYGVYGSAISNNMINQGVKIGVFGVAQAGSSNIGIYGSVDTSGAPNTSYAGYFNGNVLVDNNLDIVGNISKGAGTFKIDHPLDPENKYLYHSFIESPDMMNIYNGNIQTDNNGIAIVMLPKYFEALNKDFRYQLTCIGSPAQVWIENEVNNNQFIIKSNSPNIKVSWQITGIRKDNYANAHRVIAEVEKPFAEKGKYLHPLEAGKNSIDGVNTQNMIKPTLKKRK